ncbi:MAG: GNAT family protein [Gammaproteobacteria bacterium]
METTDVKLQLYSDEHVSMTVEWLKKDFIKKNFCTIDDISIEKHKAWLSENQDVCKWAIYVDEHIGNIFIFLDQKHFSGYMQIYIGSEKHHGRGIGYRAMQMVIDYSFATIGLHRLWLHCYPENIVAARLYKKLGFIYEGCEREAIYRDGMFISQDRWSLLERDWMQGSGFS